jgi:hypothetical protein
MRGAAERQGDVTKAGSKERVLQHGLESKGSRGGESKGSPTDTPTGTQIVPSCQMDIHRD